MNEKIREIFEAAELSMETPEEVNDYEGCRRVRAVMDAVNEVKDGTCFFEREYDTAAIASGEGGHLATCECYACTLYPDSCGVWEDWDLDRLVAAIEKRDYPKFDDGLLDEIEFGDTYPLVDDMGGVVVDVVYVADDGECRSYVNGEERPYLLIYHDDFAVDFPDPPTGVMPAVVVRDGRIEWTSVKVDATGDTFCRECGKTTKEGCVHSGDEIYFPECDTELFAVKNESDGDDPE